MIMRSIIHNEYRFLVLNFNSARNEVKKLRLSEITCRIDKKLFTISKYDYLPNDQTEENFCLIRDSIQIFLF